MAFGNVTVPQVPATTNHDGLMSASDKRDLEALKGLVPFTLMERTATGNPATFSDGYAANVRKLAVTLAPTQSGSGDPSPENIRPISGVSSVTVTRTAKNLLEIDPTKFAGSPEFFTYQTDGTILLNGSVSSNTFLDIRSTRWPLYLPEGDYIISGVEDIPVSGCNIYGLRNSEYYWSSTANSTKPGVSIHSNGENWQIKLMVTPGTYQNVRFKPMVRFASTPAGYEKCVGQSFTVSLVDSNDNPLTVYGGTLDVTTGTLTVTHGILTENNFNRLTSSTIQNPNNLYFYDTALPNDASENETPILCSALPRKTGVLGWVSQTPCISSMRLPDGNIVFRAYVASADIAAFRQDYAGLQVVYQLPAPVTYTLTAQQLAALAGYNNVSADSGTVSVTYRANPSLAYEELINAILSAGAGI